MRTDRSAFGLLVAFAVIGFIVALVRAAFDAFVCAIEVVALVCGATVDEGVTAEDGGATTVVE